MIPCTSTIDRANSRQWIAHQPDWNPSPVTNIIDRTIQTAREETIGQDYLGDQLNTTETAHKYFMNSTQGSNIFRVLFLCTGNSCRSQLAEAIVNSQFNDKWQAFSAGTKPAGFIHPMTSTALGELGIPHHGRSKDVSEFLDKEFDLVMTVCDSAREECPTWLKPGRQVHYSFPDPAKVTGDNEKKLSEFRKVRDDISVVVADVLEAYELARGKTVTPSSQ